MTVRWQVIVGVVGVLIIALVVGSRMDWNRLARLEAENQALRQFAEVARATLGKRASEKIIERGLPAPLKEFVKEAKKAAPRTKIDSHHAVTVAVEDTAKGTATVTPQAAECLDEYHRFRVVIPATGECAVFRKQLFQLDTVFVRSPDGKTRVAKTAFAEFDPETRAAIPTAGVDLKGNFTFMDEVPGKPSVFHLRPLIAVDHRAAIGAGLEFLNLERTERTFLDRLTLSVLGYYDRKSDDVRGVVQAGVRVFGNVTAGPYIGVSTKGVQVLGAGVALQVGR